MKKLIRFATSRGVTITWIMILLLLAYGGLYGLYTNNVVYSREVSVILLFGTGIIMWLESIWEGGKFTFGFKASSDLVGFFMGIVAFLGATSIAFQIPMLVNIFGPWINGIFISGFLILLWEGLVNRK